jgi:hypothetical protein
MFLFDVHLQRTDGSIMAWGDSSYGGTAPAGNGYTKIYSSAYAFAATKADGSIKAWGASYAGGTGAPAQLNKSWYRRQ